MSNRSASRFFGDLCRLLAENPDPRNVDLARKVWAMGRNYDFSWEQMGADDALVKLDLARRAVHPKYPNEGASLVYGPPGAEEW